MINLRRKNHPLPFTYIRPNHTHSNTCLHTLIFMSYPLQIQHQCHTLTLLWTSPIWPRTKLPNAPLTTIPPLHGLNFPTTISQWNPPQLPQKKRLPFLWTDWPPHRHLLETRPSFTYPPTTPINVEIKPGEWSNPKGSYKGTSCVVE